MDIKEEDIKNILVVNLGGIGDLLLSTPALRALKDHFSCARIHILVVGRVKEAIHALPYIDTVFVLEIRKPWKHIFSNLKNILGLRRLRIDLAINMRTLVSAQSARKIKLLFDVINPKISAGRNTQERGGFFDVSISEEDYGDTYERDYDIQLVERLGVPVRDTCVDFEVDEKSLREVTAILEAKGIGKTDLIIGIHPGGKPSRRWPWRNFVQVIEQISGRYGGAFVITGSQDEAGLAEGISKASNVATVNLAGKLTLVQLYALIKRCAVYITNDTGNLHIAASLKTPLVAIFGPGHIKRFDPRNISPKAAVVYKKVDCAPCNRHSCDSMKCFKDVTVAEIVEAALGFLT